MHETLLSQFSLILMLKTESIQPCTTLPDANSCVKLLWFSDNKHMCKGPEGYWREGEGTQVSEEQVAVEHGGWYLIIITFS